MTETARNHGKQSALLALLAASMFGFAFALVPLYDVFCELTGLNGKTGGQVQVVDLAGPIIDRDIRVQFLAHTGNGMPWEFRPTQTQISVRPGEHYTTTFYVRNRAGHAVTGQAVPSVTPGIAAQHLHKIECFCFEQQRLGAGEDMQMALSFYVDADLPADISTLSLAYTLFRVPDQQALATVAAATVVASN